MSKHCLVFGASGISGWALLNACISYPTPSTFSRITGLCNRPLSKDAAYLPDDPRLNLISGIYLMQPVGYIIQALVEKVESIETVDIVYFCAYVQLDNWEATSKANTNLLRAAISAVTKVCPSLETVILQTGGRGYGFDQANQTQLELPLQEDTPRLPDPWAQTIFYYHQYDVLKEMSRGARWVFAEVRPGAIVGFAPTQNAINLATGLGLYLALWRRVHGKGALVPFPGTPAAYKATHSDTFQDILAKMEIHLSLHHQQFHNGSSFNVADGEMVTWADIWPGVCSHFGLAGDGPSDHPNSMARFISRNRDVWDELVASYGLRPRSLESQNWTQVEFLIGGFDFDREYSLEKSRAIGFKEGIRTIEGYKIVFERLVASKVLPSLK